MRPTTFQVLIPLLFATTISARVIPAWMLTPPNSLNVEREVDGSIIIRSVDESTIIRSVEESIIIRREDMEVIEIK
jgi:hypothetical protein